MRDSFFTALVGVVFIVLAVVVLLLNEPDRSISLCSKACGEHGVAEVRPGTCVCR